MVQLGDIDVECLVVLPSLGNGGTEKVAVLLSEFLSKNMVVGLVTFGEKEDDAFTGLPRASGGVSAVIAIGFGCFLVFPARVGVFLIPYTILGL